MTERTLGRLRRRLKAPFARSDADGKALAHRLRAERLTFLGVPALLDLRRAVQRIEKLDLPGAVVEAGCALGGSSIMLAAAKSQTRPMRVHDVFGMIPPPSNRDGEDVLRRYEDIVQGRALGFDGDTYYGYQVDLLKAVEQSFDRFDCPLAGNNIELIQGLFEDTIRPSDPIALAHVDGDWYESVRVCLERIWPALSVGGVLIIDDYDAWSGCRAAVDEFVSQQRDVQVVHESRLHLRKVK